MLDSVAWAARSSNRHSHEKKVGVELTDQPFGLPESPAIERGGFLGAVQRARLAIFRSRADVLAIAPLGLVTFAAVALARPPQTGAAALAVVLEEQLFIVVIAAFGPIALWRRARTLVLSVAVAALVGGCLFGSEWISLPGSGAARHDLTAMSWNVQYGTRTPEEQAAQLEGVATDVVALMEVEPDAAAAIKSDPTLTTNYPYRALAPRRGAWGLAFLSRYPTSGVVSSDDPAYLDLIMATPRGDTHVIVAHPRPPEFDAYETSGRDATIAAIRARIDAALAAGDRVLVLGDFNTSPTEPEYAVVTHALRDTHVEVGEGPGWTWRPGRSNLLPVAFLRIDLQLTGGAIYPASTSIDCSLPGDHCRLFGDYEID